MDHNKITNKNAIKILEVLEGKRLYFSQIHELTKIKSKNNLVKNLNLLAESNMLKKEKGKGNTFYSINYDNFVAITSLQLINSIKFYSLPFERRKAVEEPISSLKPIVAILFGSTAKGGFKKESDIDLLIVFKDKKEEYYEIIKKVSSKYGIRLNPIIISLDEFVSPNEALKHIIKTGYPIAGYNYFYEQYKKIWMGSLDQGQRKV